MLSISVVSLLYEQSRPPPSPRLELFGSLAVFSTIVQFAIVGAANQYEATPPPPIRAELLLIRQFFSIGLHGSPLK